LSCCILSLSRRVRRLGSPWQSARICLFTALLCNAAFGLDHDRSITQFQHTVWTTKDGAPSLILSISQTADGYLWLGSLSGLVRFDGVRFEQYQPRFGGNFPSNEVASLFAQPDGRLWVGFIRGGVSLLIKDHVTNYGEREGLPPGRVAAFAQDQTGTVWAAVHGGGLARLENGHWKVTGADWNFPGKTAQTAFVDRQGTLWVATEDTVVFLPRGEKSFHPTGEHIGAVCQMVEAPDGRVWLAETTRSVRPLRFPDRTASIPEIQAGSQAILFDEAGALWATSLGDGIVWVDRPGELDAGTIPQNDKAVAMFTRKDGLTDDVVVSIFQDRESNIWVGTPRGLERFRNGSLVPVVFSEGYQRFAIVAGDSGTVWVGSQNRPITHVQGRQMTTHLGVPVTCAYRDPDGEIWLGGGGEVYRIIGEQISRSGSTFGHANRSAVVNAITKDRAGRLWIALGEKGIWVLKEGRWQRYENAALPNSFVTAEYTDAQGRLWFGYESNLVAVLDHDRVRIFSQDDGVAVGGVKVIQGHNGDVWIGGELGVAVLKEGRFQMLGADGSKPFSGVSGILVRPDGSLWLSESRGVIQIPPSEVQAAFRDPSYKAHFHLFDFADGLPGAIQQVAAPTAVEGTDGRLWFATVGGLAWIDPNRIQRNLLQPPVYISSVNASGKEYSDLTSLKLPARTTNLQISYTALSLAVPERVQFRYKLDGVDQDWQDPGDRRQAIYTNLGPGQHRFQVIASNNDGIWNKTGATLEFSIAPAFYQRYWFFALCAAAALCLAWMIHQWRLRLATAHLNSQFQERLSERTRIAQELHDTLLQGVLSASMQLDVANDQLTAGSPAKPLVGRVLQLLRQVIDDGRNAIRGLRVPGDAAQDLAEAFSRIPQELGSAQSAVDFRVLVEGTCRPLHPMIRDEVYRIGREAVVNAFRHSGATSIEVELEYGAHELRILVRDNGRGIDSQVLRQGKEGHWGLSGMRERADKIGANLKVWSGAAGGTEVELRVPGRMAFESQTSGNASKRVWKAKS
jgi:signal transduction histidine kinase/ligand-binding sensor domain-containing protein